jgi:hypothetical protein
MTLCLCPDDTKQVHRLIVYQNHGAGAVTEDELELAVFWSIIILLWKKAGMG